MMKKIYAKAIFILLLIVLFPAICHAHAKSIPLSSKYTSYKQFVVIDKSENKLALYENGKLIKTFSVATGAKPSDTPEGLFSVLNKVKNRPYYKEHIKGGEPRNPLGDRWIGLLVKVKGKTSYAYAIHGTNQESSIGKHISHGCIRMHKKDIHWLYENIKIDTPVLIQK